MEPSTIQDVVTTSVRVLLALTDRQQKDLAEVLQVNASGITRRMTRGTWSIEDLEALAKYFGVPIAAFFEPVSSAEHLIRNHTP